MQCIVNGRNAWMFTDVVGEFFPGGQRVVEQREAQFSSKFAWKIQRIRGWRSLTKYLRQSIHNLQKNRKTIQQHRIHKTKRRTTCKKVSVIIKADLHAYYERSIQKYTQRQVQFWPIAETGYSAEPW